MLQSIYLRPTIFVQLFIITVYYRAVMAYPNAYYRAVMTNLTAYYRAVMTYQCVCHTLCVRRHHSSTARVLPESVCASVEFVN